MQSVTLDDAIENLDKILAHIICEEDNRLKGIQIGQAWQQLKCIKEATNRLGYFDRRSYNKQIVPLEQKLKKLEDSYISELELAFAIEDGQKLNELIQNYKKKFNKDQKEELKEKILFFKKELEQIIAKNQHRMDDMKWAMVLGESQQLVQKIDNYSKAHSDDEIKESEKDMDALFKTMKTRINDDEEEELLTIVQKMQDLKEMQGKINIKVEEEGLDINEMEKNVDQTNDNTQQALDDYEAAKNFVTKRRRTKIKLFFSGLFAALGSFGGIFGGIFGAAFGAGVGTKVAKQLK